MVVRSYCFASDRRDNWNLEGVDVGKSGTTGWVNACRLIISIFEELPSDCCVQVRALPSPTEFEAKETSRKMESGIIGGGPKVRSLEHKHMHASMIFENLD